jgi:hypothetical protein
LNSQSKTVSNKNNQRRLRVFKDLGFFSHKPSHLVKMKKTEDLPRKGFESFLSFVEESKQNSSKIGGKDEMKFYSYFFKKGLNKKKNSKANLVFSEKNLFHRKNDLEKNLQIVIKQHHSRTHSASLLIQNISRFIIAFIKKRKGSKNKFNQLKNVTYRILQTIKKHKLSENQGIGFTFSGRAYGAKKAASFKIFLGSVPFSTLKAEIDYDSMMQKTKNGT